MLVNNMHDHKKYRMEIVYIVIFVNYTFKFIILILVSLNNISLLLTPEKVLLIPG